MRVLAVLLMIVGVIVIGVAFAGIHDANTDIRNVRQVSQQTQSSGRVYNMMDELQHSKEQLVKLQQSQSAIAESQSKLQKGEMLFSAGLFCTVTGGCLMLWPFAYKMAASKIQKS